MIPSSFLQDLLARTDIEQVVSRHVELKRAGIHFKGLCPFHGEKTPSFIVSPSRQTYHCFGCGAHGDAIRFLTDYVGLGFVDAVTELAEGAGLTVPEDDASPEERARAAAAKEERRSLADVLEKAAEHYRGQLKNHPQAVSYLKQRGLTGEVAKRFGLGYAPPGWNALAGAFGEYDDPLLVQAGLVIEAGEADAEQEMGAPGASAGRRRRWDRFRDRIIFPIRDLSGRTLGFGGRVLGQGEPKYLNSPETPLFSKGHELYGLFEAKQAIRRAGRILVTEGYMDVVALAQSEVDYAVATLGTACTPDHLHKLVRLTDEVVFCFDGDAAGRKAAARALATALPFASDTRTFRFAFLPPEHDPDSYVRAHGKAAFEAMLGEAVPLSRQLLAQAAEGCDLAQAEGRARMLAAAQGLWQQLPDGALKPQLLQDIAVQGQIALHDLQRLWKASSPRGAARTGQAVGALAGRQGAGHAPWRAPTGGRPAAQTLEDIALKYVFANSAWWLQLDDAQREQLHSLAGSHGELVGWMERSLMEHGPRPWASLKLAVEEDQALSPSAKALLLASSEDDANWDDLCLTLDRLAEKELRARAQALSSQPLDTPEALAAYREVHSRWKALHARLTTKRKGDGIR